MGALFFVVVHTRLFILQVGVFVYIVYCKILIIKESYGPME